MNVIHMSMILRLEPWLLDCLVAGSDELQDYFGIEYGRVSARLGEELCSSEWPRRHHLGPSQSP